MSDEPLKTADQDEDNNRDGRKFSVSANRVKASHKVRYVEMGGSAVDFDECALCESVPKPSDPDGAKIP